MINDYFTVQQQKNLKQKLDFQINHSINFSNMLAETTSDEIIKIISPLNVSKLVGPNSLATKMIKLLKK